jgi:uncharacterized protein YaaR (DUF327 family)
MDLKRFRQIIREEVKKAIQEELKEVLTEAVKIASTTDINLKEDIKPKINKPFSSLMNETKSPSSNNPIMDLLNETANEGEWKSLSKEPFNSTNVMGWNPSTPNPSQPQVVSSVSEMTKMSVNTGDINSISIDAVPDFTGLMKNLKEKGKL